MLATLLLLAQLVLPWPGLDSPLVQPPGMICLGACAGPVIYGAAERGRLVVACDMTSDTCSDGRKITTTRATPVPCEVSPGVWEMVPEDTACISWRGLESWAATTSYLAYGADLSRASWGKLGGAAVTALPGGGYRVTGGSVQNVIPLTVGEERTAACIMRAAPGSPSHVTMYAMQAAAGGKACVHPLTDQWATYTCTSTATAAGSGGVILQPPHEGGLPREVDVLACWSVRASVAGRACWGGEAPVTCGGEVSEISTAGWPTTHGSIEIEFRIDEAPQDFAIILDGRSSATVGFNIHYARATGRLNHRQGDRVMEGPTITLGTWYRVRLEREGGDARMYVNGVLGAAESDWPAWSYPYKSGVALLGRYTVAAQFYVNGSISSLTVRSYEEVSP